jgi:hypothetical protein
MSTVPLEVVAYVFPSPRTSCVPLGSTVPSVPGKVTVPTACVAGVRMTPFSAPHPSRNSALEVNGTACSEIQST